MSNEMMSAKIANYVRNIIKNGKYDIEFINNEYLRDSRLFFVKFEDGKVRMDFWVNDNNPTLNKVYISYANDDVYLSECGDYRNTRQMKAFQKRMENIVEKAMVEYHKIF